MKGFVKNATEFSNFCCMMFSCKYDFCIAIDQDINKFSFEKPVTHPLPVQFEHSPRKIHVYGLTWIYIEKVLGKVKDFYVEF